MNATFSEAMIFLLVPALLAVAVIDLRTRTIPHWLTGGIALAAIPFWYLSGLELWPDVAMRIGVAALVFGAFTLVWMTGQMGGGDVKLLGALALWLPWPALVVLIVIMSIGGGVLTVAMLARRALQKVKQDIEVPYGVAIALGGVWLIGERFLNQFG
jgi:prepilin peptidase CpaA